MATTPFIRTYKNGSWVDIKKVHNGTDYAPIKGVHNGTEWVEYIPGELPPSYGRLYNSYIRSQGDPTGLSLPTANPGDTGTYDYDILIEILFDNGYDMPALANFDSLWLDGVLNSDADFGLTDFNSIPTGRRSSLGFIGRGSLVPYLTASDAIGGGSVIGSQIKYDSTSLSSIAFDYTDGLPIRYLVSDTGKLNSQGQYTDLDGNVYETITISSAYGIQTWLASDWRCTKYPDGSSISEVTNQTNWNNLTRGAYCNYV